MVGESSKHTLEFYRVIHEESGEEVIVAAKDKKDAILLAQDAISDREWRKGKVILEEAKQAKELEGLNLYAKERKKNRR